MAERYVVHISDTADAVYQNLVNENAKMVAASGGRQQKIPILVAVERAINITLAETPLKAVELVGLTRGLYRLSDGVLRMCYQVEDFTVTVLTITEADPRGAIDRYRIFMEMVMKEDNREVLAQFGLPHPNVVAAIYTSTPRMQ